MNNEFLRQYKRIGKACGWDFSGKEGELKEVLVHLTGKFPEDMSWEIAENILAGENLELEVQKGVDIQDLHNGELNESQSVLTEKDWQFLKEIVNVYAAELDMEWVTYFMQILLDREII